MTKHSPPPEMEGEMNAAFEQMKSELERIYARHGRRGEELKAIAITIVTTKRTAGSKWGCDCPACMISLAQTFARTTGGNIEIRAEIDEANAPGSIH